MNELREITYRCRDIGYGVEEGEARGMWGERQQTGSRLFMPTDNSGPPLYLFDDEVVSDEPADPRWAPPLIPEAFCSVCGKRGGWNKLVGDKWYCASHYPAVEDA